MTKAKRNHFIPVCEPVIGKREEQYVLECLRTRWISSAGKYVDRFEELMAKHYGVKHAVAVANGTCAVHAALLAAGVGPEDEVIIPDFTLIVSASQVIMTGAQPVLVDVDPDTWCMDPEQVEKKITRRTKVIMPVHMYGHPADMGALKKIARKHGIKVVADCAQAHGVEYQGSEKAILGDMGTFSFYGNKVLTTGEGGMVVTDNTQFADKVRLLRNQAFVKPRFHHSELGYNYRITNIQAAIGTAQVEQFAKLVKMKRRVGKAYLKGLKGIDGLRLPVEKEWAKNVYWMFGMVLEKPIKISRDHLMEKLRERGVDSRAFFYPMHQQKVFRKNRQDNFPAVNGKYPVSKYLGAQGLYLPSGAEISQDDIRYVCDTVKELIQ
ncbi:MAG: DegT/DnrJ/EryC1/StrS family aminotransferase [Proteobacteria bacterium]|nr:DegT/DnrJ/EryC1/StrS family aminotransferase [Pseudomonadota bacterium]MBU1738388.1 DegT/DnrJ/EryC1/StrS family aminotransferase [Pseudomonadota bacterium]